MRLSSSLSNCLTASLDRSNLSAMYCVSYRPSSSRKSDSLASIMSAIWSIVLRAIIGSQTHRHYETDRTVIYRDVRTERGFNSVVIVALDRDSDRDSRTAFLPTCQRVSNIGQ